MAVIRVVLFLTLLTASSCESAPAAKDTTPIRKVISLITDLKAEVETDGEAEANVYQKFASECQTQTSDKSSEVTTLTDTIKDESASIELKSSQKAEQASLLAQVKAAIEKATKDLDAETARCKKQQQADLGEQAHISKATDTVHVALKKLSAINANKPGLDFFLLQEVVDVAWPGMVVAVLPKAKHVTSMVQGESSGAVRAPIVDHEALAEALTKMQKQFQEQATKLGEQMKSGKTACHKLTSVDIVGSYANTVKEKTDEVAMITKKISQLDGQVGAHRGDLVKAKADLDEVEVYMKDLTLECQSRAKDWDQRAAMRNKEVNELQSALDVVQGKVATANVVNKRVLLQKPVRDAAATKVAADSLPVPTKAPAVAGKPIKACTEKAPCKVKSSFRERLAHISPTDAEKSTIPRAADVVNERKRALLQEIVKIEEAATVVAASMVDSKSVSVFKHSMSSSFLAAGLSAEARTDQALQLLSSEGQRLGSLSLTELAQRAKHNPMAKVQALLNSLTQRLMEEAINESSKKGFCETELAKTRKERDYRHQEKENINADIEGLQAKEEELKNTITRLGVALPKLASQMSEETALRNDDKKTHAETLETAKKGLAGLQTALKSLQKFYSSASLMQESPKQPMFIQASPVQGLDAGFSGSYKGKAGSTNAILGLLETIESDFQRTIRTTESSEATAVRDWVIKKRNLAVSIKTAETNQQLSQQELEGTRASIKTGLVDLTNTMDLIDNALKQLETLKPTCIDTGMSHADRVSKREEEKAALKKAFCMLEPADAVSEDCK